MNLSNDGFVAFHYRSYGTFFLQQNRLHNIHRGFTHYKYYRALKRNQVLKSDSFFLCFYLAKAPIGSHGASTIGSAP